MTIEEITHQRLKAPFLPSELDAIPSSGIKDGKAKPAFYLNTRAVQQRLDAVFGLSGWSVDTDSINLREDTIDVKEYDPERKQKVVVGSKRGLLVATIVKISVKDPINKIVSNVGERGLDEDSGNKVTSSWAQAFKRSASLLGVGAYLYYLNIPPQDYKYGKFTTMGTTPPEKETIAALREVGFKFRCEESGVEITWQEAAKTMHRCGKVLSTEEAKKALGIN